MKDSETGQRGYLITGEDRYLEPYNAAVAVIQDRVQRFKHLTEDNPRQQARIPPLEKQISAKLKVENRTIALRKKNPEAARQVVLTGEGKKNMEVIRAQVHEMQQEERDLLVTRERQSRQSYVVAALTILFTVVLGLGMVGAIVYVLQRHLAERQKAARSLARLAAIVESSDDAILSKGLDGIIQTWNAGAEHLLGYRPEEVIGQPITLLLPPERIQEEQQILDRLLSGQRVEHLETVRVSKDGRRIDVSVTVSPVRGEDGQIIGASKVIHDITDRKRAEEELRSVAQFPDENPYPVMRIDRAGTVLYANASSAALSGEWRCEMGRPVSEPLVRHVRETLDSGQPNQMDMASEGRIFSFLFAPITDSGYVNLYGRDITDRKRAEEELRKLNTQLEYRVEERTAEVRVASLYARSLIEASLDPLVTISAEGKITDVNDASVQATGVSREKLIGTDFSNYFTEPEKARAGYEQVFREGSVRDYPLELRHRDGHVTSVLYNASIYRDEGGQVVGVFAAARDITERKRAEAAAQAERQRLFDVLETLPAMICLLTPDYHVTFANRGFREKFGESHGRHCYEYCFGRTEPCEFCESYTVLKTGQPHHWEVTGPDGSVIDAYDFPFTDVDGSPMILEMDIDITDRRNAETALKEANEGLKQRTAELAASNGELEAFSYTVSHDLRAPLRHITSFVALLDEEAQTSLNEQCRHYMQNISEAAQRMGHLIDDLLTFSRIGRAAMTVRPVSLRRLVDEARTELASETDGRAIDWQIGSLPEVSGDPALLRSVMVNLLSNAIKYTRQCDAARIEVGCREEAGEVICFVRDNGAGFDMKFADKLFGVFQRLHRAEDFDGTGIGLASVRRAVHRHGGRTWAEGELARGATFYFSLPCRRNDS
jgi:PAS domain S-box-containing protein